jgi:uncharacterized protein (DUF1499 family)
MRWLIWGGFGLAVTSGLVLALAGPAYRGDVVGLRTAFALLRWAASIGIGAALVSLAGLAVVRPRGGAPLVLGLLGIAIGTMAAYVPWRWREQARSVPPIHDITTDLEQPPAFDAILPLRADAPNPAEYGGPEIAAQQREAYPEVRPLELAAPPGMAFRRALAVARDMGWEIVAADSAAGRIEATATTRWFGFMDDVVVRITATGDGSRVDVRSVSRVGRSDVGTNAERIRQYLGRLSDGS